MRPVQINMPDLVVALPDNQHFFRTLHEIDGLLWIEQEGRCAIRPAACLTRESGLACLDIGVPPPDFLTRPRQQDWCVRIAHLEGRLRAPREVLRIAGGEAAIDWSDRARARSWRNEGTRRCDPSHRWVGREIRIGR